MVGSRKTARARPCSRPHTGRSLVSASRESGKWPGPPTKRRALRAYRRIRPCPSPPLGVVAPHRIPRLVAVACLARYASSLAGATFTPAQPPSVINSPFEKTNLTQKQPSCASQPPRAAAPSWTSNPYWCRPPPSPSRLACASPRRRTRPLTRRMRARHRVERRRTLHAQRAFLSSYRRVRAETGRGYF